MEVMSFKVVLLGAIPEAILILWAGLVLLGVKAEMRKVVFVGVLQGVTTYFIRRYFDFGIHMMLSFATLVTYTYLVMKINLPVILIAVMISFAVVILVEGSVFILLKANIAYIFSMEGLRLLYFLPQDIVLFLIIYFSRTRNISLSQELRFLNKIMK